MVNVAGLNGDGCVDQWDGGTIQSGGEKLGAAMLGRRVSVFNREPYNQTQKQAYKGLRRIRQTRRLLVGAHTTDCIKRVTWRRTWSINATCKRFWIIRSTNEIDGRNFTGGSGIVGPGHCALGLKFAQLGETVAVR